MRPVIENLYVGDIEAAGDHPRYEENSIDTVIQLTHSPPDQGSPEDVDVHSYSMMDGPRNDPETMQEAIEKTVAGLEAGKTVLVHCSAGASRSVSVCTAAAALHDDLSFDEAMDLARISGSINAHPSVEENARNALEEIKAETGDKE